jgi:hypothetical protein
MRCPYCKRRLRLLDARHPQRLLLPRCRVCGRLAFGVVHKVVLFVLAAALFYLLVGALLRR